MYATVAREYNDEDDFEYEFTDEEIRIFEQRRVRRIIRGESKTFSWDEAKRIVESAAV